jgi:hypothetical protein
MDSKFHITATGQQYVGERNVNPLIAGPGKRERSQQRQQSSDDVDGVVEAIRLEDPENVMVRHLGVVGEASQNEPDDPQDYHDEAEKLTLTLL